MSDSDFAGFGVRGYRSLGSPEMQTVGPLAKSHLIVGQNNVGKSNLLHFAHDVLPKFRALGMGSSSDNYFTGAHDAPLASNGTAQSISIAFRLSEAFLSRLLKHHTETHRKSFVELFQTEAFSKGHDKLVWFDFEFGSIGGRMGAGKTLVPDLHQLQAAANQARSFPGFNNLSMAFTSGSGGSAGEDEQRVINALAPWALIPEFSWVDAVREIRTEGISVEGRNNGTGLVTELARLQNPEFVNHENDTKRFEAFQRFVREVLEDREAQVQIPNTRDTLLVRTRNGVRPLETLGTGIGEVVMLAAAATGISGHVICIEEPEVHLHPTLQRKLIQYLNSETDNRYLISTHSASLLNADTSSISHLTMPEQHTLVHNVRTAGHLFEAIADLGNRASDLVQSNFIVWVEGPSDRTYLAHWISMADGSLIEGAHYSVMFYGGALLKHLAADDTETEEFIQLMRINRRFAIIIDSDKKTLDSPLNETKMRVISEADQSGALTLVTEGYTVENYIPRQNLIDALHDEYPTKEYELPTSSFASPLAGSFIGTESKPSKVRIARRIVEAEISWHEWPPQLREGIEDLARRIARANGL